MERKQGAVVRPSRSISRPVRPRLVVASRTYMDIMVSSAERPAVKVAKTVEKPKAQPPVNTTFFDMKSLKAPSEAVRHTAPALKPISKVVIEPPVQALPQAPAAIEESPAQAVAEIAEPLTPIQRKPFRPAAHKKQSKLRSILKKPTKHHVLHGVSVLLFIAGIYVAAHELLANHAIRQQASVLGTQVQSGTPPSTETKSNGVLSERLPIGLSAYSVESNHPRVLHIPSLAVVAPVLHQDAEKDGSLATPRNIYETGWYKTSARPTDKEGAMVVTGHVSGPTKPGVFHGLKGLEVGKEIVVERGDRHMMTFVVKRVEKVEANQLDIVKLLDSVDATKLGLNLIASTESGDNKSNSYLVVYAAAK